ncbi:protein O-mannosyl-transferase TMTC1 isoform X6 [Sminthopsis crassicaudata]|uniref:protein O-mannosyl-transferase TMTC1 isoform X6 n=1 Tax=Sminthopsis crassicaudata TaxID=9301 RepID=UPI003D69A22D
MVVTTSTSGGVGCGSRRDRTPSGQRQRGYCLAPAEAAVLLTTVCCLCYGNSLRGEFVHDDVWAIVNNPDVQTATSLSWGIFANDFWGKGMAENTSHKSYRPLCILTFKLNVYLAGMNPFYFHAVNIILHCLVTLVLMYTCDKVVFKDHQLGFVTALIFAVHPIHTEAVTGIVGRADVLACLLFLLAFLSYNRSMDLLYIGECLSPTTSPFFLLLSLFLGTCAMLVKETGITVFGVCLVYDLFSLPHNRGKWSNHEGQQWISQQPVVSELALLSSSHKENAKPHSKGTWNSCSSLLPTEQNVRLSMSRPTVWTILRYLTTNSKQNFLYATRPFLKRATLVISYVIVTLCFRMWIMGGSMPLFSEQDNPASFSPYILTRFLTYSYLLAFNSWLLLAPITLCYDWQVGSIPLIETIWDIRNLATLLLVVVMLFLILHCLTAFKNLEQNEVLVGLLFLVFPFLPASNLFFNVGFVVAERVLYMPRSQGKKEDAIIFLRDSIRFGPEFADAYSSLASLLAEQELFQKAEEVYQAGIKNCPESSDLHNNYGVFLVDTGTPESAMYHYQQAIQLSPHHHVAMVNLGRLYRSLGENKEAEEWYKRALDITQTAEILSPLGALYYNTGRYEEALRIYREAAALQPSAKEIQLALAQVLAMMGQTEEAEKMTNHIVSEEAGCLECYRLLSAIYSKQEHYPKALEAIDKALQLKPKDPKVISELFFTKGNQLREQNFLDKAFESYQVAVQLNPEQAQAWMNMGGIEHIKGDYVSARGYYEKALQLVPNSKLLKENLAKLDRLEKRLQEVSRKRSDTVAL